LKYAYLALDLDNEGEGGTFALFALIKRHVKTLKEKGVNDYRVIRNGRRYRLRFGRCSPGFETFKEAYNQPVFA